MHIPMELLHIIPSPRRSSTRLQIILSLILALCAFATATPSPVPVSSDGQETSVEQQKAKVTTAPIFLPHYDDGDWSAVRGSIISSNPSASETTYTIFCPTETAEACAMSLDFPFILVEGPRTVKFHGTVTSAYTAILECELNSTVAATCSGYESWRSGDANHPRTGPTETSWTSTLHGSDVQFGTLTLAEAPSKTSNVLGITMTTGLPAGFESSGDLYYIPSPTDSRDAGTTVRVDRRWALATILGGVMAAAFVI